MFYRLENDHVRQLVTDAVYNAGHAAGGVPGVTSVDRVLDEPAGRDAALSS